MQIPARPIEDLTELADSFILDPGAVKVLAQALGDLEGAVDHLDDLPDGDFLRRSAQGKAAIDPFIGLHNAGGCELMQDLQGKALGDAGVFRNLPGTDLAALLHDGVYHAHRIIGLSRDFHVLTTAFVYAFSILLNVAFVNHFYVKKYTFSVVFLFAIFFQIFLKNFKKPIDFSQNAGIIDNVLSERTTTTKDADVAESADALASGASGGNFVGVQVPSSAPQKGHAKACPFCISPLLADRSFSPS